MQRDQLKAERRPSRADLPRARPGHRRVAAGRVHQGRRQGPAHRPGPRANPRRRPARPPGSLPEKEPFDGDPLHFRLGVEALRLGLAYEHDPYFSLSIARVDPLPHQLEAVYDYFLKLPRIRFLLADDPGAGKTIMAGLLLKELKIRGLVKRTLIVTPANLSFQWQRETEGQVPRAASRWSAPTCCAPTTAPTPGRRRTRSSPRFPGSRASRTPRTACCAATGISSSWTRPTR